jgi:hypothetical protein
MQKLAKVVRPIVALSRGSRGKRRNDPGRTCAPQTAQPIQVLVYAFLAPFAVNRIGGFCLFGKLSPLQSLAGNRFLALLAFRL